MSETPAARWNGVRAGVLTWLVFALALLPSRWAVAMRVRGGSTFERVSRVIAGTCLDLLGSAGLVFLALVGSAMVARWATTGARQRLSPLLFASLLAGPLYLLTVTEQEIKAERGAFATAAELWHGMGENSLVEGSLGFIRYERIWVPLLFCGAALVFLVVQEWRSARRAPVVPWRPSLGGLLLSAFAGFALLSLVVFGQGKASTRWSPGALGDPLASLAETSWTLVAGDTPADPRALLFALQPTEDQVAVGAARLGWPAPAKESACTSHPARRPLDRDGEPTVPAARLVEALERLSAAAFSDQDDPLTVFQFSLESFRADDLSAFHQAAPRVLTPYFSELVERPQGVLVSRRTFQAGVRTAQGLAAMVCGLGTLPFNLSLIRDFTGFPLRCSSDVLSDAGFQVRFFYGSDPAFDEMGPFFLQHGAREVVAQDQLPPNLPKGAWRGVADRALFAAALDRVSRAAATAPQFAFVMSLSNHSPFTPPEDLPDEVEQRVTQAMQAVPNRASPDDRRRLITFAYTDFALHEFLGRLDNQPIAATSMVVLLADHSTGNDYVWGPANVDHETDAAKAQVPFVIVFPEAFVTRLRTANRDDFEPALRDVQRLLDETQLSQNDVPRLLLALLSHHPRLRTLPGDQRWHTLGGQQTSPWFKASENREATLVGINGVDELYLLDAHGERVGSYEDAVFLKTAGERDRVTPTLIPVAATLGSFLHWQERCSPH